LKRDLVIKLLLIGIILNLFGVIPGLILLWMFYQTAAWGCFGGTVIYLIMPVVSALTTLSQVRDPIKDGEEGPKAKNSLIGNIIVCIIHLDPGSWAAAVIYIVVLINFKKIEPSPAQMKQQAMGIGTAPATTLTPPSSSSPYGQMKYKMPQHEQQQPVQQPQQPMQQPPQQQQQQPQQQPPQQQQGYPQQQQPR